MPPLFRAICLEENVLRISGQRPPVPVDRFAILIDDVGAFDQNLRLCHILYRLEPDVVLIIDDRICSVEG